LSKKLTLALTGVCISSRQGEATRLFPKSKDQVGSRELRIADDKKTVGWLAEYENCCTSYAVPLKLVIYRDGKVRQRLGDGMMI
jgi:hypothetical protein